MKKMMAIWLLVLIVVTGHAPYAKAKVLKAKAHQTESRERGIYAFRWSSTSRVVIKVYEGGPAARAGLLPGDKILLVDGKKGFPDARSGDSFIFTILRNGNKIELEIFAEDPKDIKNPEVHHIWTEN